MPPEFEEELAGAGGHSGMPWIITGFEGGGSSQGMRVRVEGSAAPKTLWSSADYLGLGADEGVRAQATAALEKFTVGSCGPRGFYGTTTAHLDLEHSLAAFLRAEEGISYSDSTATIASVIPAFAKRGDVLLIDSEANYGIQQGARLSRSKVVWWEHNNMAALETHLRAVRAVDASKGVGAGGGSTEQRRFIVVEGLYAASGSLAPLPDIMRLAREYKWRVILDDSCAFGVLGETGRGTPEHFGMREEEGPSVLVGSLSTALGSVGGFCVGTREVVEHQRLSGVGYCFSASAPPYLCASAVAALEALGKNPSLPRALRERACALHAALCAPDIACAFEVVSDPLSPTKHLRLCSSSSSSTAAAAAAASAAASAAAMVQASGGSAARGSSGASSGARLTTPPSTPSRAASAAHMLSPTTQRLPPQDARQARALGAEEALIDRAVALAADKGVLVTRLFVVAGEPFPARPSLKFHLTLRHTEEDVAALLAALREIVRELF